MRLFVSAIVIALMTTSFAQARGGSFLGGGQDLFQPLSSKSKHKATKAEKQAAKERKSAKKTKKR